LGIDYPSLFDNFNMVIENFDHIGYDSGQARGWLNGAGGGRSPLPSLAVFPRLSNANRSGIHAA
jgi:hypothetical protein